MKCNPGGFQIIIIVQFIYFMQLFAGGGISTTELQICPNAKTQKPERNQKPLNTSTLNTPTQQHCQ